MMLLLKTFLQTRSFEKMISIYINVVIFINYCVSQDPRLEFMPLDASLPEGTRAITSVRCLTCSGNLTYSIRLLNIVPTTNCNNCFAIWDQNQQNGAAPNYCLQYVPGSQPISYSQSPSYILTVECLDSEGNRNTGVIQVRILPNSPPVITSPSTVSMSLTDTKIGSKVYRILATDPNDDPLVFTLETEPRTSEKLFQVDNQGQITVRGNIESTCLSFFTLTSYVTDNHNVKQGPVTLNVQIKNPNIAPATDGLNREVYIDENTPQGTRILNIGIVDTPTYNMVVRPINMDKHFTLTDGILSVNIPLNYELDNRANISFTFSNGPCKSKYWLMVNVNDVNDEPELTPETQSSVVKEGHIFYNPKFTIQDEDRDDNHIFELDNPNEDAMKFSINPVNGVITSTGDFDLDTEGLQQKVVAIPVKVTDTKGNAIDTATVMLTVTETNDNDPEFTSDLHRMVHIMECERAHRVLTMLATDKDFGRNGEVLYTYTAPPDSPLIVTPSGVLYQLTPISPGETFLITINAVDRGDPQRTSGVPVTISVVGVPCTTPPPSTTIEMVTDPPIITITEMEITEVTTAVVPNTSGFFDDPANVLAIVLGSILGLALLSLAGCLLWKLCCSTCCGLCYPIRHLRKGDIFTKGPCQFDEDCCRCCKVRMLRCCGRPEANAVSPVKYKEEKQPDNDTSYNFWKEHYNDKTYTTTDHRQHAPTT